MISKDNAEAYILVGGVALLIYAGYKAFSLGGQVKDAVTKSVSDVATTVQNNLATGNAKDPAPWEPGNVIHDFFYPPNLENYSTIAGQPQVPSPAPFDAGLNGNNGGGW